MLLTGGDSLIGWTLKAYRHSVTKNSVCHLFIGDKKNEEQGPFVERNFCFIFGDLPSIISFLSQDPGISSTQPKGAYPPYDVGLEMGIFINSSTGETFIGQVIINAN